MEFKLRRKDQQKLDGDGAHAQIATSGIVRIVDTRIGGAHSAHPNIADTPHNRRAYPQFTPAFGWLYSPDVFTSTELDRIAAQYCACPACEACK